MNIVDYCVCCNSKNIEVIPCSMYRFVVERMTGIEHKGDTVDCGYIHCLDCDYGGSQIRFSQDEENRYYKDYMIGDYVDHRCRIEGEHFRQIAAGLYTDETYELRKRSIKNALEKVLDLSTITSILDFGGNTGNSFPLEVADAKRYVTDVEIRKLSNGVIGVTDPEDCGLVDVVVSTHTLEHVSDPLAMINAIKKYLRQGGWLYLEVPSGEEYGWRPPVLHEHINHFSGKCLTKMLELSGFQNMQHFYVDTSPASQGIIGQLK